MCRARCIVVIFYIILSFNRTIAYEYIKQESTPRPCPVSLNDKFIVKRIVINEPYYLSSIKVCSQLYDWHLTIKLETVKSLPKSARDIRYARWKQYRHHPSMDITCHKRWTIKNLLNRYRISYKCRRYIYTRLILELNVSVDSIGFKS